MPCTLNNPALSHIELNGWNLCAESLNFLEDEIQRVEPTCILELGSGASTVCFSQFIHEHLPNKCILISIEQDSDSVKAVKASLIDSPVLHFIFHAPAYAYGYSLNAEQRTALANIRPDFVVIDGPSGELGCRAQTLPGMREFLMQASNVYADDAYRDAGIIQDWQAEGLLQVDRILATERGLMVGRCAF